MKINLLYEFCGTKAESVRAERTERVSLSLSNLLRVKIAVIRKLNLSIRNENMKNVREYSNFRVIGFTVSDALKETNESFSNGGLFFIRKTQEKTPSFMELRNWPPLRKKVIKGGEKVCRLDYDYAES